MKIIEYINAESRYYLVSKKTELIKSVWVFANLTFLWFIIQGIVDGSAYKPALAQDTNYMVEKTYHTTYHMPPYLGAFRAYLLLQWLIYGSKAVSIYQNDCWKVAVNSRYLPSGQKAISFGQKQPQQIIWFRKLNI